MSPPGVRRALRLPAWPYPRIVAHRGGGSLAPENTLGAIATGARLGLKMVEFDAKLCADKTVFLLHDDRVERTSDGQGEAAALRYDEIAQLDAGSWYDATFAGERMPTLADAFRACTALGLAANIEIKPSPGWEAETGTKVARQALRLWRGSVPAPLLSSFSYAALSAARAAAPSLPRGLLYGAVPPDWQEQAASLKCLSLHVDHQQLDAALIGAIKGTGLYLLAYTVNDPERARELLQWGVDAICTDRLDLINAEFA